MAPAHVGYLDLDGKVVHFRWAGCQYDGRELDVEAEGPKCRLHLYGIPFAAAGVAELAGRTYGPGAVTGDPIAEGAVETRTMWLAFERLEVRCGTFDAESATLTVSLAAEVRDAWSGRSGTVDCRVRCTVVDQLWPHPGDQAGVTP